MRDSVWVYVELLPNVFAGNDTTICIDDQIALYGTGASYLYWENGIKDGSYFTPDSAVNQYYLVGVSALGCVNTDDIIVSVAPRPTIDNTTIIDITYGNDGAILIDVSGGTSPYSYDWDYDGVGDKDDPEDLYYIPSGDYEVVVYDSLNCTATTTAFVEDNFTLYISGGFSPNGDGINDTCLLYTSDAADD